MSEPVASKFDLSSLQSLTSDQENGTEIEILHPGSGESLGIKMVIAGPDSKRQKNKVSEIIAERTELRLRKVTAARLEDENIRIAAASIVSWSGVMEGGKELEFSPSVALGLLTRYPFIREQVTSYANDRANFLKK